MNKYNSNYSYCILRSGSGPIFCVIKESMYINSKLSNSHYYVLPKNKKIKKQMSREQMKKLTRLLILDGRKLFNITTDVDLISNCKYVNQFSSCTLDYIYTV